MKKIIIVLIALTSLLSANCDSLKVDYEKYEEKADKHNTAATIDMYTAYMALANSKHLDYNDCKNEERFDMIMNKSLTNTTVYNTAPAATSDTYGTGY